MDQAFIGGPLVVCNFKIYGWEMCGGAKSVMLLKAPKTVGLLFSVIIFVLK